MSAYRAIIVDDERLGREAVSSLLRLDPDFEIVSECADGTQAVQAIQTMRPDVVFLDVQMPEGSGFDVLRSLSLDSMPVVVFVTAFDSYAVDAFRVHAADYLVKPFDQERFSHCTKELKERLQMRRSSNQVETDILNLVEELLTRKRRYLERISVKNRERYVVLKLSEVDWIEAADNYVQLHRGKDAFLLRETLANLETRLDPGQFRRIHRSFMVNVDRITEISPWFTGDYVVTLSTGKKLTLSRKYRDQVKEELGLK